MEKELNITGIVAFNFKILIAEDNDLNFILLNDLFAQSGIQIIRANNGFEALQMSNDNFDLILMDIHMPIMDGLEATREIKKLHPAMPIIAITGYIYNEDIKKCTDAGCDGFIPKPVNFEKLFGMVNLLIEKKSLIVA